jgi:(E)-4-hydroxy-3-methylbut-2-enyl-diphosphate synthase
MRRLVSYYPKVKRKKTRVVYVGKVAIGGENPIRVQSMTSTPTWQIKETLSQIERLYQAGCELVRLPFLMKSPY